MWIIHPVFITLYTILFNVVAGDNTTFNSTALYNGVPIGHVFMLLYGIICFLIFLVVILLILLCKMQCGLRREAIHITSVTGESLALRQNNILSVSSPSGDGGDDSSSTSSGTPEGSLADLSSCSQRYASLHNGSKSSDYINVSENALPGRMDFHNKKMDIDYENVEESQRKEIKRKGQASCEDTTSVSSDESINYSKIVFTKTDK
ncbi:uncharacterized protein [Pseudorasbora parva]|uniref:uncharacterized protein n=1 Tax=Pseudorasbora parva TaxID=51549 RepID=UPI00351EBA0B